MTKNKENLSDLDSDSNSEHNKISRNISIEANAGLNSGENTKWGLKVHGHLHKAFETIENAISVPTLKNKKNNYQ